MRQFTGFVMVPKTKDPKTFSSGGNICAANNDEEENSTADQHNAFGYPTGFPFTIVPRKLTNGKYLAIGREILLLAREEIMGSILPTKE